MPGTEQKLGTHFYSFTKWKCSSLSCVQLCDAMDCSLPGSSVHGILQTRILEWVVIPFSRGSSQSRNQTPVSHFAGRFFTIWVTREDHSSTRLLLCPVYARNIKDQGQEKLRACPVSQSKLGSTQVYLNPEPGMFYHLWPQFSKKSVSLNIIILPAYFYTFLLPLSQNTFATIFHKVMHCVTSFISYLLKRELKN